MPSTLEYSRIIGSVYPCSLNFTTLFASHLSSILALFFSKSLVKLLLRDERSSILTQVLLFHQLFHCPWWKGSFLRWDVQFSLRLTPPPLTRQGGRLPTSFVS